MPHSRRGERSPCSRSLSPQLRESTETPADCPTGENALTRTTPWKCSLCCGHRNDAPRCTRDGVNGRVRCGRHGVQKKNKRGYSYKGRVEERVYTVHAVDGICIGEKEETRDPGVATRGRTYHMSTCDARRRVTQASRKSETHGIKVALEQNPRETETI